MSASLLHAIVPHHSSLAVVGHYVHGLVFQTEFVSTGLALEVVEHLFVECAS